MPITRRVAARVVAAAGLPLSRPRSVSARYLELMRMDKKAVGGSLRFVVLEGPGRAAVRHVDEAIVGETIESFEARPRTSRRRPPNGPGRRGVKLCERAVASAPFALRSAPFVARERPRPGRLFTLRSPARGSQ